MQYITVKDLKKLAKKERKNNNNLQNHSESLNYVSNKYYFKNWEELLDNSVLVLRDNCESTYILNNIVNNIYNNLNSFNEILNSESYNVLSNYIHNTFNNRPEDGTFGLRGLDLIYAMSYLFFEINDKKDYVFDNYYKYLKLETILKEIHNNEDKLKNSQIINEFLDNTLYTYIKSTPSNPIPEQCDITKEQFNFLSTQYIRNFNIIKNTLKVFNVVKITKKEIIELLKVKDNLHLLYNNPLLDKDNLFLSYTKELTGNEYSVYNDTILDKHIKLLESL